MKRAPGLICISALIVFLTFLTAPFCLAADLSSIQIKKIEKGVEKLESDGRGIRRQGYNELRRIGTSTAPYVIEVLKKKDVNFESKVLACNLLGSLKAKKAVPGLVYALKDKSYAVRIAACQALGKIGDHAAIKPLLGILNDPESRVREAAVKALRAFNSNAIPPRVAKLLKDKVEYVRVAAIALLNDKLDSKTVIPIREAFQKDGSGSVRQLAAQALGGLRDDRSVDALAKAVTEDDIPAVREESAIALGKIGDKKAIPALIEALKDNYKDVQLRASYALGNITGQDFGRDYDKWTKWYKSL
jgi:HEAT repeat protein